MKCGVCNTSGSNMKKCQACNNVYCYTCASNGKGHYPKPSAANVCPYCNTVGKVQTA